jgi:hypothetical protein
MFSGRASRDFTPEVEFSGRSSGRYRLGERGDRTRCLTVALRTLAKRVKRSDVAIRAYGKRTANALCALTRIALEIMTASPLNANMTRVKRGETRP